MTNRVRPVLLGYIRAEVLRSVSQVEWVEAQLFDFADREEFSLGTVYVERGITATAFHSLMTELAHDDAAWGFLIPDLRHLTDGERQVLGGHGEGVQTRIVMVGCSPGSGAAGAEFPAWPDPPCHHSLTARRSRSTTATESETDAVRHEEPVRVSDLRPDPQAPAAPQRTPGSPDGHNTLRIPPTGLGNRRDEDVSVGW